MFDRVLTPLRGAAVVRGFGVDELHGQAGPRVLGAAPGVMRRKPRRQILGDTRVERAVGATNDVDVPGRGVQSPSAYNNVSLYMMKRPKKMTPNHATSDTAATTLALVGALPSGVTASAARAMPVT